VTFEPYNFEVAPKICVPFWEPNVAEFQRKLILGKRLSEHKGDGWILDGILMKRVLKIGGGGGEGTR
jgi:hypothetical protein